MIKHVEKNCHKMLPSHSEHLNAPTNVGGIYCCSCLFVPSLGCPTLLSVGVIFFIELCILVYFYAKLLWHW